MKLSKLFIIFFLSFNLYASKEKIPINIDFKDLEINDFIKLTSKILDKNILISKQLSGKINFISNTTVYKGEILDILLSILETKGFTLVQRKNFLEVVRSADASNYNLPVYEEGEKINDKQFITSIIKIEGQSVDVISSKIKHFLSKYAKIVSIKENNSIIVTDYPSNIKTIKKTFNIISQDIKKEVMFFELKNIQGNDILNDLNNIAKNIFNQNIINEKVDIFFNKDTNSIIAIGVKKNINKIKDILHKLDFQYKKMSKSIKIVRLKYTNSVELSKVLLDAIAKRAYKAELAPSVSTEKDNNHILIIGYKTHIKEIEDLIHELDKETYQVFVKAKIIEVSQDKSDKIGFKYGFEGGFVTSSGLLSFASNLGSSSLPISGQILKSIKIPENNVKEGLALGATLDFLKKNGAADIVSEPSILCINNKECSIYVGRTQSIAISSTKSSNNDKTETSYKREDIGITLKVKAFILTGEKVTLKVDVKTEDIIKTSDSVSTRPTTTKREIKSVTTVNTGETVIVGGLIKNKNTIAKQKVPFLGDIPFLGALFRYEAELQDKSSLLIVLTPYIVEKSQNLKELKSRLMKLNKIQSLYNMNIRDKLKILEEEGKNIYDMNDEDVDFDDVNYEKLFQEAR